VRVVNVLATVRDKKGKIVNNLTREDFILAEDGRPQTIRYFTRQTDLPLTLGLLVDTSFSQARVLNDERTASGAFTDDVLRADKDSAFLIQFSRDAELLQDLTKSPQKMHDSLSKLNAPTMEDRTGGNSGGGNSGGSSPGGGGYPGGGRGGRSMRGGGTVLYDAVFLASDEMMRKQKGRKALVVLTDGVDRGSKESLDEAIESAQRTNTIVYSVYFAGQEGGGWQRHDSDRGGRRGGGWPGGGGGWPGGGGGWPGGGGRRGGGYPGGGQGREQRANVDGKKILERLSKETGGRMFVVSKKETISQIYSEIQDELRNQYSLGYTPDRDDQNAPDYRHIQVTTRNKDMTVVAREGYYASQQLDSKEQGN
jgi:VWFA-related protein